MQKSKLNPELYNYSLNLDDKYKKDIPNTYFGFTFEQISQQTQRKIFH